jgi:hypothetical protein
VVPSLIVGIAMSFLLFIRCTFWPSFRARLHVSTKVQTFNRPSGVNGRSSRSAGPSGVPAPQRPSPQSRRG